MTEKKLTEKEYFYLSDGGVMRSISELSDKLSIMDDSLFFSYVNDSKNDFYNWIKYAVGNKKLAEKIKNCKTKNEMYTAISDFYNSENKKSKQPNGVKKTLPKEKNRKEKTMTKKSLKKSKKQNLSKTKPKKTKLKTTKNDENLAKSFDQDFDYSLDLGEQRDILADIRKRISEMDKGLKDSFNSDFSSFSRSIKSLDDYPELDTHKLDYKIHKKKPKKSVVHHIHNATKNASGKVSGHVKNVHGKVRDHFHKARKKAQIHSYMNKTAKKIKTYDTELKKTNSSKQKINPVEKQRELLKSMGSDDNEKNIHSKSPNKISGFFKGFMKNISSTSKVVKKELPNLHEFEHQRKAEERIGPYSEIEHKKNYHIHGFPDFIKGLLIGLLMGMLFIILF